jgi:enterochelin esterase-like enzyme
LPKATPRAGIARSLVLALLTACAPASSVAPDAGADPAADAALPGDPDGAPDPDGACPTGGAGLDCLFDLYDAVADGCDADDLDRLRASLAARHGDLPAWHATRTLFVSYGEPVAVAGAFNGWAADALVTAPLCGTDIFVAETTIASGRHPYKLVRGGTDWILDPENWGFVFDSFAGNPDGANSVVNSYDSGVGHLVHPDVDVCSTELDNCRRFFTYLPAGYGAPANADRRYPALFMHDGQNIFDDQDCCFGHTGWEVNVQLDTDIAAGEVEPVVVVGFPHAGASRGDEYAYKVAAGGAQETFMAFQVGEVQPAAAALWRLDPDRYFVAGSSFGGLVSMTLAFTYPDVYAGAASLSGSYWVGEDDGTHMSLLVDQVGFTGMPLYLDHGGTAQDGGDNYQGNLDLRDQLIGLGWSMSSSPACTMTAGALCYYHDVGATHDELAWRDRSFQFLRFLLAP